MSITTKKFGKTKDRKEVTSYTLTNENGMEAEFIDYGARLVKLLVPDAKGKKRDVVLGFDNVNAYEICSTYYGAFIGRNGNRIGNASFELNGKNYELDKNDGNHNLHSGFVGFDKKIYEAESFEEEGELTLEFSRLSKDMEQGFPGNLDLTVTYTLTQDNALVIEYFAVSDKDTVANLTNHSYFNLAGHDSGDILNHKMKIEADCFALTDQTLIPTGVLEPVEGTPMDFRSFKRIGEEIDAEYEPMKFAGGYDHHFQFTNYQGEVNLAAEVIDETSGIHMEVFTDRPGTQFYTGNFINGEQIGKNHCVYQKHAGFCLETQFVPDAVHLTNAQDYILKAGKEFDSTTVYKFSTK